MAIKTTKGEKIKKHTPTLSDPFLSIKCQHLRTVAGNSRVYWILLPYWNAKCIESDAAVEIFLKNSTVKVSFSNVC